MVSILWWWLLGFYGCRRSARTATVHAEPAFDEVLQRCTCVTSLPAFTSSSRKRAKRISASLFRLRS